jgi:hypothetical protein
MRFKITYVVGKRKIPTTETIDADTVGELSKAIELIIYENNINRSQIIITEDNGRVCGF